MRLAGRRLVAHRSPSALLQRAEGMQRPPKARVRVMPGAGIRECSADRCLFPCRTPAKGRGAEENATSASDCTAPSDMFQRGRLPARPESRAFCWRKPSAFRRSLCCRLPGEKGVPEHRDPCGVRALPGVCQDIRQKKAPRAVQLGEQKRWKLRPAAGLQHFASRERDEA